MTIFLLVRRSLTQHVGSTLIATLAIALAGGLLMTVWVMKDATNRTFTSVTGGFDGVLGPRSSKLQLVLNSLFHLDESPGNVSAQDAAAIANNPSVAVAVPIAVGDNYRGYRLVGTTHDLFERIEPSPGQRFSVAPPGRLFREGEHEAVLGAFVARQLQLRVGDTFHPFHGLLYDEEQEHSETFVVTGILEPSNTPADRVIWIPLEGLQTMSGHNPKFAQDVSAVLVKLKDPGSGFQLDMIYNKRGDRLTFAWPIGAIMAKLFDRVAWADRVLQLICYVVVVVGLASILATVYTSMHERRREIAILRSLGARRGLVFSTVVAESAAIAGIGMLLAFGVYAAISSTAAAVVRSQAGVVIDPFEPHWIMAAAPAFVVALAALLGVVPAAKAYRTDVAAGLVPIS